MKRVAALIGVLLLTVSAVNAGEVVCFDASNFPYMYEKEGKPAGLYPAIVAMTFQRAGIDLEIKVMPWKRAVAGVDAAESALGGCYKNSERLKKYDFTDPIYEETMLVYVPKGKTFPMSSPQDLEGKTIGVILGWSYGDALDQMRATGKIQVDEVISDDLNIRKLAAGRLDAIVIDKDVALRFLAQKSAEVEPLPTPYSLLHTHVAFNKKAQKKDVIAKFNAALKAMREDGTYEALIQKHHNGSLVIAPLLSRP